MNAIQSWRPLRGVDAKRLSEAREQAHHAVQWLAKLARAAVPPQPDDSHANFGWDDKLDGFATRALKDGARLGLRLRDLTLVAMHGEPAPPERSFALLGHSDAEARDWMGRAFQASGVDAKSLERAVALRNTGR